MMGKNKSNTIIYKLYKPITNCIKFIKTEYRKNLFGIAKCYTFPINFFSGTNLSKYYVYIGITFDELTYILQIRHSDYTSFPYSHNEIKYYTLGWNKSLNTWYYYSLRDYDDIENFIRYDYCNCKCKCNCTCEYKDIYTTKVYNYYSIEDCITKLNNFMNKKYYFTTSDGRLNKIKI